jgi:hypothetical protein
MFLRSLSILLSATFVLACATHGHAATGAYAGRASLNGGQPLDWDPDKPGSVPLAEQGGRLAGDRVYAGYRFRSGLGVEGMQLQSAARDVAGSVDTFGVAGTVCVPLADKLTATARAGLHVAESSLGYAAARPAQLTAEKLFGIGVSYRVNQRVELTAESQRFDGRSLQSATIPAQTYTIGARLHF